MNSNSNHDCSENSTDSHRRNPSNDLGEIIIKTAIRATTFAVVSSVLGPVAGVVASTLIAGGGDGTDLAT